MRNTLRKYSRRHGWMQLRSYAPGDGSIDFVWASEQDPLGPALDEPVTESDVSEFLELKENIGRFRNHEILILGKYAGSRPPYNVRIAKRVMRPFHTSKKLVMDDTDYEYIYHGPADPPAMHSCANTDFYAIYEDGSRDKVDNISTVASLCFFLNHEKDFEANGYQTRSTKSEHQRQESLRQKLKPVPDSILGHCVGHHPERRIYREVECFDEDPWHPIGKRLVKAHPATVILEGDLCTQ